MAQLIIYDLYLAVIQLSLYPVISGIILVTAISVVIKLRNKEPLRRVVIDYRNKLAVLYLFYIYCFLLIGITFTSREPGSRIGLNIIPFSTFSMNIESLKYIIENVMLFIPFGFLLPLLIKPLYSLFRCTVAGLLVSFMIEFSQLLTGRGFFQIDDIIFNTFGSIIGLGILMGCKNFRSTLAKLR